jgi:ribosomal-protein-alanine N-acetyltransferase
MTNLAVDPAHRRKSVAKELLGYILGLARRRDCELMLLEVRSSNEIARQFYEAEGFVTVEQSPSYYDDPTEDALVMMRRIRAQQGGS